MVFILHEEVHGMLTTITKLHNIVVFLTPSTTILTDTISPLAKYGWFSHLPKFQGQLCYLQL